MIRINYWFRALVPQAVGLNSISEKFKFSPDSGRSSSVSWLRRLQKADPETINWLLREFSGCNAVCVFVCVWCHLGQFWGPRNRQYMPCWHTLVEDFGLFFERAKQRFEVELTNNRSSWTMLAMENLVVRRKHPAKMTMKQVVRCRVCVCCFWSVEQNCCDFNCKWASPAKRPF